MSFYKNKKIAVLGLSVEGIDSAVFFGGEQAHVTCCDRRTKEVLGDTYTTLQGITSDFRLGPDYLSDLNDFDYIVRTPGMALRTPELQEAKRRGVPITSLTKLFFKHCRATIIGITGTKGKGTTSTLLYEMLKKDGKRAWLGGNVGTPLLSKVKEIEPADIVVLELSSFQLEDLTQSPHIAVVLKITQEHLANFDPLANNYHISREAYVDAKKSIVRYQQSTDMAILNADDATSSSFSGETKAKVYYFSRSKRADAFIKDKTVYLRRQSGNEKICSASEIKLLGMHNLENIAASALASAVAGVNSSSIRAAAIEFQGLEHRLEFVRTIKGVTYYNDSFSTIPETTIAAIESFDKPIVLIVGGSEKGSEYGELGHKIALSKIKTLIVIGTMTNRILDAAFAAGYSGEIVRGLRSMHEIVGVCAKRATAGDIVLLSPSCASFDMFKNYKDRGAQFKHEVSLL